MDNELKCERCHQWKRSEEFPTRVRQGFSVPICKACEVKANRASARAGIAAMQPGEQQ